MSYSILGAGAIGFALATQFSRKHVDVRVASTRGPVLLAEKLSVLGPCVAPASISDAIRQDIIILAIPFSAVAETGTRQPDWRGRIVVDATNALSFPSFKRLDLGGRRSTDVVAESFPGAGIVKAFNTLPAAMLGEAPQTRGGRRVIFLSGNDPSANSKVADLVERLGYAALDLGRLADAAPLQEFGGALMVKNLARVE